MIQNNRTEAVQLREYPMGFSQHNKPRNIPWIVREVLQKYGELGKPRVDVLKIAFGEKIHVIKNSPDNFLDPGVYGMLLFNFATSKWIMVYDDTRTLNECRFTVAHELGHYFLGHKDDFEKGLRDYDPEIEADLFACECMRGEENLFMIPKLKQYLNTLDEEIERAVLMDLADTRAYANALRERRLVKRTIRRFERIQNQKDMIHKKELVR